MMRLQRIGRRNNPSYRVVVTDKRTGPKSNKHVAIIGSHNPKLNQTKFNEEQVKHWLSHGVKPSPTVHNLLVSKGLLSGNKINVLPKKSPIIDNEKETKAEKEASEAEAKESPNPGASFEEESSADASSTDKDDDRDQSEVIKTELVTEAVVKET